MIDPYSLDSLLFDCVNHSKYSEDLKQRLRNKISKSENLKLEYKKVVLKYRHLKKLYDDNTDNVYYDACDSDLDDANFNDIVGDTNISIEKPIRPPTEYNIFIRETMVRLKASNPTMNNTDLMLSSAQLWQKIKKQPEVSKLQKLKVLHQIKANKITKDMLKATNLLIENKTNMSINYK
jgi:hypothetical protein